jgi:hypothetical protein
MGVKKGNHDAEEIVEEKSKMERDRLRIVE